MTPPGAAGATKETRVRSFLSHCTLYVSDIKKSMDFYSSLLGLTPGYRPDWPDAPGEWLYTANGHHVIHFVANGPVSHEQKPLERSDVRISYADRAFDHMAFSVDELDIVVERLEAMGVPYRFDTIAEIGARQVFFRDPDGVGIEVNDFRDAPGKPKDGSGQGNDGIVHAEG